MEYVGVAFEDNENEIVVRLVKAESENKYYKEI